MDKKTEQIIEEIDGQRGRKHRLPYHSADLYVRISVRQPGDHNVHTLEFSYPNYTGTSHPTERSLQGTATKVYRALAIAFGKGVRFGGVPVVKKDTYA